MKTLNDARRNNLDHSVFVNQACKPVQWEWHHPMRLSKFGYYGDFFVYPALIAALTLCAVHGTTGPQLGAWLLFSLGGIAAWTVAEYFLHRTLFHKFPFLKQMHDAHHTMPKELLGTPTWLSVATGSMVIFGPLWWAAGFMIASAISTGLMIGYLWYVTVHHCNHHANPRHDTYLYWAKRRHSMHHYCGESKNFGVITDFWDRLLGTELQR